MINVVPMFFNFPAPCARYQFSVPYFSNIRLTFPTLLDVLSLFWSKFKLNFYKYNLRMQPLFSDSKTTALFVNVSLNQPLCLGTYHYYCNGGWSGGKIKTQSCNPRCLEKNGAHPHEEKSSCGQITSYPGCQRLFTHLLSYSSHARKNLCTQGNRPFAL